jgi:hypothetical protein
MCFASLLLFLCNCASSLSEKDFVADGCRFKQNGTLRLPTTNPQFKKVFYSIRLADGSISNSFQKIVFHDLNEPSMVIVQYLGDHQVATNFSHGQYAVLCVIVLTLDYCAILTFQDNYMFVRYNRGEQGTVPATCNLLGKTGLRQRTFLAPKTQVRQLAASVGTVLVNRAVLIHATVVVTHPIV